MKEQIKISGKELNKMELSNLSDAEFKTLVIRMLKECSEDLYLPLTGNRLPFTDRAWNIWLNL